jgi:proline dehydrogenase
MGFADTIRVLPQRAMRSVFISLSHRRSLARLAVRSPLTRPVVARFVAGETLDAALPAIAALRRAGLGTTVDVLGESTTSPEQATAAVERYLATVAALSAHGLEVTSA